MRRGASWEELRRIQACAEMDTAPLCPKCKGQVKARSRFQPCLLCGEKTDTEERNR